MNCKVISTYFGNRRYYPSGFEETADLLKEVVANENLTESGVKYDTIFVNHLTGNDSIDKKAKEYLGLIDGKETENGKIIILHRDFEDGIGGSYKSFNHAFEVFKEQYEHWSFIEDDVLIIAKNWYSAAINQLHKNPKTAFVCFSKSNKNNLPCHCHSGGGVTHIYFLIKVFEKYGSLLYCKAKKPAEKNELRRWYRKFELEGEVQFTNSFEEFGRLEEIQDIELPIVKIYQKKNQEPDYKYPHNN